MRVDCVRCGPLIKRRIHNLAHRYKAHVDQGLASTWKSTIDSVVPGWEDYIFRGTGDDWRHRRVAYVTLNGPINFTAAAVRQPEDHTCPECNYQTIAIVFNFRVAVWAAHLLGHAAGSGLSRPDLLKLGEALLEEHWDSSVYPPATSNHGDILWYGVSWFLFHEFGHHMPKLAASLPVPEPLLSQIPTPFRDSVRKELQADAVAYDMLCHRVIARNPLDLAAPATVLPGAEFVLRITTTRMSRHGLEMPAPERLPILIGTHPGPSLRIRHLHSIAETLLSLRLAHHETYRRNIELVTRASTIS